MNTITKTLRTLGVATAVAISLTSFAAHAFEATPEQRKACMPDAFRLCSKQIPNVDAVIACMAANRSQLSPACRTAFDQTMPAATTETKVATNNY
jgi:hypothetical protein